MNQKKELQRQEPRPLQSGEQRFLMARQAVKIAEASHTDIAGAIKYAMIKIGLRANNWPSKLEKVILMGHIIENFGQNTVEEIRMAFDWAIDERLELGKDGYNCFENFSCAYFSKIMKAYNRLASMVKIEPEPSVQQLDAPKMDPNEYDKFLESDFAKKLIKSGVKLP